MIARTGIDLNDTPIFVDRGTQIAAAKQLEERGLMVLSLKFCDKHITLNIHSKFNIQSEIQTTLEDWRCEVAWRGLVCRAYLVR